MFQYLTPYMNIYPSSEMMMANSFWLVILSVSAFCMMLTKIRKCKLFAYLYGSLCITAITGIFFPIEFGLLGVNVLTSIIFIIEFIKYKKK